MSDPIRIIKHPTNANVRCAVYIDEGPEIPTESMDMACEFYQPKYEGRFGHDVIVNDNYLLPEDEDFQSLDGLTEDYVRNALNLSDDTTVQINALICDHSGKASPIVCVLTKENMEMFGIEAELAEKVIKQDLSTLRDWYNGNVFWANVEVLVSTKYIHEWGSLNTPCVCGIYGDKKYIDDIAHELFNEFDRNDKEEKS